MHFIFSHIGNIFGSLFHSLKAHKISIHDTPIEGIDNYVFYGINETLSEIEFVNTNFNVFPKSIDVCTNILVHP